MNTNNYKNMFVGENKYTTGLIFLFATLIGFFTHMRKLQMDHMHSFFILIAVAICSFLFSKI